MKKLIPIIAAVLLFGCDKVNDDNAILPSPVLENVIYVNQNETFIIPLFGDFDANEVTIQSNTVGLSKVDALYPENSGTVFVKYTLEEFAPEFVDIELSDGSILQMNSVEIRPLTDSDCVDSGFSDHYQVAAGEELVVDLTENDAFCEFVDSGSRGATVIPVMNDEGVLISVFPGGATMTYTSPEGFTGTVEFIYEICFGLSQNAIDGHEFNPDECEFYYTALATIDVI